MIKMRDLLNESTYPDGIGPDGKKIWDSLKDDTERRLWWKAVQLQSKYMVAGRFKPGLDPYTKKLVNQAFNDLDRYRRNLEKKSLNLDSAKKIFKSHGLTGTKYRSTSIRGYSIPSSNSYEIEKHDPSQISFHGVAESTFNSIVNSLEQAGFKIENSSPPSRVPGGPSHASIKLGK